MYGYFAITLLKIGSDFTLPIGTHEIEAQNPLQGTTLPALEKKWEIWDQMGYKSSAESEAPALKTIHFSSEPGFANITGSWANFLNSPNLFPH